MLEGGLSVAKKKATFYGGFKCIGTFSIFKLASPD